MEVGVVTSPWPMRHRKALFKGVVSGRRGGAAVGEGAVGVGGDAAPCLLPFIWRRFGGGGVGDMHIY
eukprot:8600152-Pyramimonas_sp.AAC.1